MMTGPSKAPEYQPSPKPRKLLLISYSTKKESKKRKNMFNGWT